MATTRPDEVRPARAGDRPEPDAAADDYPRLRDLPAREWLAILKRAGKEMLDDNMPMIAQALAYSSFLAIPSVLLLAVGLFTLVAGPQTITTVIDHLGRVMPGQATQLLSGSLHNLDSRPHTSLVLVVVGAVLALWSTVSAMTTYMTALNMAYDRKDRRGFVKQRLTALVMVAAIGIAFLLIAVFLIFGPPIERHLRDATGIGRPLDWIWWAAQWPVLIVGLLAAFATLLYLGPDVDHPRWRFLTPGSALAVVIWLAVSGAFAFYTSNFGSYNKTWGSLAAVIIMLTWLWLTSLALLFGAEVNAELERSRELMRGEPAEDELQVPSRADHQTA
jgi:membrane protein